MTTDNRLSSQDLNDVDFVDAIELASDGYFIYRSGVLVDSIDSGTKVVTIDPVNQFGFLINTDTPLQVGDRVLVSDGYYYIVESIINNISFTTVEIPVDLISGTAVFMHPAGSNKVGVDSTTLSYSNSNNLQKVLEDINNVANNIAPIAQYVGEVLFAVKPGEHFHRATPITGEFGWLVNEQGTLIVNDLEDDD